MNEDFFSFVDTYELPECAPYKAFSGTLTSDRYAFVYYNMYKATESIRYVCRKHGTILNLDLENIKNLFKLYREIKDNDCECVVDNRGCIAYFNHLHDNHTDIKLIEVGNVKKIEEKPSSN